MHFRCRASIICHAIACTVIRKSKDKTFSCITFIRFAAHGADAVHIVVRSHRDNFLLDKHGAADGAMLALRQARCRASGRDGFINHLGMSSHRNARRIAVAAARASVGHLPFLLACRLLRLLTRVGMPERGHIVAVIRPAADRTGIDRIPVLRTRRHDRLPCKIFVLAARNKRLRVHEQIVVDLLCKRSAVHKRTLVGVLPGKPACNDITIAQCVLHQGGIALCILQYDIRVCGKIVERSMAAIGAVQYAVGDSLSTCKDACDDVVR